MFSCGAERPWAAVGMDLFMEKPVNRDKLRAMLDLLESDSWQRNSTADSAQLPSTVFADNERCASLGSFSGGLDIKVGACQHAAQQQLVNGLSQRDILSCQFELQS